MTFEEYFERFEKMQRWIITDLSRSAIEAKANFLVAMGIFNYIEVLGAFYITDTDTGYCSRRFRFVFTELFTTPYKTIFNELEKLTSGAYSCLRCGMTHEYLIKTYKVKESTIDMNFTIYGVDSLAGYTNNILTKKCGIELIQIDTNYHLRIFNPRLIHDFNLAFEEYKTRLLESKQEYRKNFLKRCAEIKMEKLN